MTEMDYEARLKATGRNDRCPCGSGKKYKKCHLPEDEGQRSAARRALAEEAKAKAAANAEEDGGDPGDPKAADRNKRLAKPNRGPSGSRAQTGDAKPKNIPRRGAV